MIKFGPSSASDDFYDTGHTGTAEMPGWVADHGLDAFEYSCGKGVRISSQTAAEFGALFKEKNIEVSLHAPYFINLATPEEEKQMKNISYFTSSLKVVKAFGGSRVVFHPGSPSKRPRKEAMETLFKGFDEVLAVKYDLGYGDLFLCAETMGKVNQLGTVDEIISVCSRDKSVIPCVDFGHVNAREGGILKTYDDYKKVIDTLIEGIGAEKTNIMHIHFSKIEYGAGGEKKHLTFEDTVYGPDYQPLMQVLHDYKMSPVVICESRGTQTKDAVTMKEYYNNL